MIKHCTRKDVRQENDQQRIVGKSFINLQVEEVMYSALRATARAQKSGKGMKGTGRKKAAEFRIKNSINYCQRQQYNCKNRLYVCVNGQGQ